MYSAMINSVLAIVTRVRAAILESVEESDPVAGLMCQSLDF